MLVGMRPVFSDAEPTSVGSLNRVIGKVYVATETTPSLDLSVTIGPIADRILGIESC